MLVKIIHYIYEMGFFKFFSDNEIPSLFFITSRVFLPSCRGTIHRRGILLWKDLTLKGTSLICLILENCPVDFTPNSLNNQSWHQWWVVTKHWRNAPLNKRVLSFDQTKILWCATSGQSCTSDDFTHVPLQTAPVAEPTRAVILVAMLHYWLMCLIARFCDWKWLRDLFFFRWKTKKRGLDQDQ